MTNSNPNLHFTPTPAPTPDPLLQPPPAPIRTPSPDIPIGPGVSVEIDPARTPPVNVRIDSESGTTRVGATVETDTNHPGVSLNVNFELKPE